MYPGQTPAGMSVQSQVAAYSSNILALANANIDNPRLDCFNIVFPVFMAGFAATDPDVKVQAIRLICAMENTSAGRNTSRSRELLVAVCEEQRRRNGAPWSVDWVTFSRECGLELVNFGL